MTNKQRIDIEVCKYFIPEEYKPTEITAKDMEDFLAWSQEGKYKYRFRMGYNCIKDGFDALALGKSRRGLHIELYENGVLEGTVPYFSLLGGFDGNKQWWQFWKSEHKPMPKLIVDFIKKEMFQGRDSEIIESVYVELNKRTIWQLT